MGVSKILGKAASFLGPIGQAVSIATGVMSMAGGAKKAGGGAAKTTQTPATTAVDEEEARRKRLLALNAQGGNGQLTPAGGDTSTAPIGRKTLLGQ